MRQIKLIIFFWTIALFSSCITPFDPEIEPGETGNYVVNGQVTDLSEIQTVNVSKASSINDPKYIPVTGCYVVIRDNLGNSYELSEAGRGNYSGLIGRANLIPGRSFMIEIMTRDGIKIESDFDKMYECPDVDSVYYQRKDIISANLGGEVTKGIQFYVNLDATNIRTNFFRWELIETFEYQVPYAREWYYNGTVHHILPVDYSRKVCWSTQSVRSIFTLSTQNLSSNKYEMLPLHYIDNKTSPRLAYGYYLVVNQHALSESAYSYWDQLRTNSNEQGGLYEKQPLSIVGNLHNLTDPGDEVLGYFGVSSVRIKRLYIRRVPHLENEYIPLCNRDTLRRAGFSIIQPYEYPAFLMGDQSGYKMIRLSTECVDCLIFGGTNVKPDYWPHSYE